MDSGSLEQPSLLEIHLYTSSRQKTHFCCYDIVYLLNKGETKM